MLSRCRDTRPKAADAAYRQVDLSRPATPRTGAYAAGIHQRVVFSTMRASGRRACGLDRGATSSGRKLRMWSGATHAQILGRARRPVSVLNSSATSAAIWRSEVKARSPRTADGLCVVRTPTCVVPHARPSRRTTSAASRASSARQAIAPYAPDSSACAPSRCCGARRSAPGAPRAHACFPRSAASMSAGTSAESSEVRYTVILIASTSGSRAPDG